MDVRGLLAVGVDDDLVDKLHQLVVGSRRLRRVIAGRVLARGGIQVGQQLVDGAAFDRGPEQLGQGFFEFALRRHAPGELRDARKHLGQHARAARGLGVQAHHDQAFGRFLQGNPAGLLQELALERSVEDFRADAPAGERLVGHAMEQRKRRADLACLDPVLGHQDAFQRRGQLARLFQRLFQRILREPALADQSVVTRGLAVLQFGGALHALADGRGQRLAQLRDTFDVEFAERPVGLVVDDLQHSVQHVAFQDGRDDHLLAAIARALVHFLEETQSGMDALERFVVIDIGDVEQLLAERHVARQALRTDGQLQFAAGVQPRLHLGDDGRVVLRHGVEGQAVGIEQLADVGADVQHELLDVVGGVDLGRDVLQLAKEQGLEADTAPLGRQLLRFEEGLFGVTVRGGVRHCAGRRAFALAGCGACAFGRPDDAHRSNSWPARSQRMSCGTRAPKRCVWSNRWISAMMRSVSEGLVWVM